MEKQCFSNDNLLPRLPRRQPGPGRSSQRRSPEKFQMTCETMITRRFT